MEIGGRLVQLAEGAVGDSALVEVGGGLPGLEVVGQFTDVVLGALVGAGLRKDEGTENDEFRIENVELLGFIGRRGWSGGG